MERDKDKMQKDSEYDHQMGKIRDERMMMRKQYESLTEDREGEYQKMMKDNFNRMTKDWGNKLHAERKARYKMMWDKIAKIREGEESIVMNKSVANIMEQETKLETARLI
jgi:hypothetical protein